ncbi:MAG: FG-GAP-like repeat-containing protein [Planctomycetota bacterium]
MVNHQRLVLLAALGIAAGCAQQPSGHPSADTVASQARAESASPEDAAPPPATVQNTATIAFQTPADVQTFCGACHAVPNPASFPRDAWYHEVQRGYQFYFDSGRTDLVIPVQASVVAWYQSQAPEQLPRDDQPTTPSPIVFERHDWKLQSPAGDSMNADSPRRSPTFASPPGVSFVDRSGSAASTFWFSDMLRGRLGEFDAAGQLLTEFLGVASNPAAVRVADLDQDGRDDLVVADLGSALPADHDHGRILWISDYRSRRKETSPASQLVLDHVGRVADVRPGDFDGDGDPDLVAAEFGWHTTGGLHVIWNDGRGDSSSIRWRPQRLDSRPGGIHVPVLDLDGDGRLDFLALISQEHESVEVFLNRPDGFKKQQLFAAPDPSWGSSGIEPVDFDADGDMDLLYTAGDTFDSRLIKPFHGIWLLINHGEFKFESRHLAALPGVHRALASDLDQDGDLDVVACSILPAQALQGTTPQQMQAVIWLEQQSDGSFLRHCLQSGPPQHPAMTLADLNGDGKPEILTAVMSEIGNATTPSLEVFFNRGGQ